MDQSINFVNQKQVLNCVMIFANICQHIEQKVMPKSFYCAPFTSHGTILNYKEPKPHMLDFLHLILLCRMAYRAPIAGDYTDVCKLQYITRGVSHYGLAIHIKKYLKAKEESWKFKYFTMQKCNLKKKNPLKETKYFMKS